MKIDRVKCDHCAREDDFYPSAGLPSGWLCVSWSPNAFYFPKYERENHYCSHRCLLEFAVDGIKAGQRA